MSIERKPEWVLPSEIPFDDLTDADLEECVYWLLDAMGAKDLEWRKGSAGRGAADGGRDLEATLYQPAADGDLLPERWWVECKGRKGTLEREAVQNAVVNAQADGDLDVLVVATNTTFTNPTRDWVALFQRTHERPAIRLWDRYTLERQLGRQPGVVLRLFSQALSPAGRLQAVEERFWNRLEFSAPSVLAELWARRADLTFDGYNGFAVVASEFAVGGIVARPWGGLWPADQRLAALYAAVLNTPYLLIKTANSGVNSEPMIRAIAYLLLACLETYESAALGRLLVSWVTERDGVTIPATVAEALLVPVLNQLLGEIQEVCSSDCRRVMQPRMLLKTEEGDEIESYWMRLSTEGQLPSEKPDQYLRIERTDAPCVVGFALDAEISCPLFQIDPSLDNIDELLAVLDRVATFRKTHKGSLATGL